MSQQSLDLRASFTAVRRHRKLFAALVLVGLLAGGAWAVLSPPALSSTALVVLPQATSSQNAQSSSSDPLSNIIATQVVIADSGPVLAAALPHVSPAMSLQQLEGRVQVQSLAGSIISISATGKNAADAEATANAVAGGYIRYVNAPGNPAGQVSAKMLEPATTATGGNVALHIAIYALLGALGGALVGLIASLALSNNDRRLTRRDAIANSIGAPVLASFPVARPGDAPSWSRLLDEYEPGAVHAWGLTRLLQQMGAGAGPGREEAADGDGGSVTVLSLASDPGALALGPQLAAFAAAQGIPTALIIGPQQDNNVTATLQTACAVPLQPKDGRRRPLQLLAADKADAELPDGTFVVVVAVVNGRQPLVARAVPTAATVLGVSAGGTTAEELARVAVAASADGREVAGILVANPDPADQSSGRIARLAPASHRRMPTRVNDLPTEASR